MQGGAHGLLHIDFLNSPPRRTDIYIYMYICMYKYIFIYVFIYLNIYAIVCEDVTLSR